MENSISAGTKEFASTHPTRAREKDNNYSFRRVLSTLQLLSHLMLPFVYKTRKTVWYIRSLSDTWHRFGFSRIIFQRLLKLLNLSAFVSVRADGFWSASYCTFYVIQSSTYLMTWFSYSRSRWLSRATMMITT